MGRKKPSFKLRGLGATKYSKGTIAPLYYLSNFTVLAEAVVVDDVADDVARAALHLLKDAAEVLSHDGERDELYGGKKEDEDIDG